MIPQTFQLRRNRAFGFVRIRASGAGLEQVAQEPDFVEAQKDLVGACQQAALGQHPEHGGSSGGIFGVGRPPRGQVIDETAHFIGQSSFRDGAVHGPLEVGGPVPHAKREAVPGKELVGGADTRELLVVW